MVNRTRKESNYDITRRNETLRKLTLGFKQLKASKKYKDKPVTAYALSKHTGVSYDTIKKYDEILEKLSKEKNPGVVLKTAVVDIARIFSVDEAIGVINILVKKYNEIKDMYNDSKRKISELNLQIVRLESEKKELELVLKRKNNSGDIK